eukprot:NODE_7202_length_801_cov_24.971976_g6594_i0.p1 GENE.NODE_7202_length_801_cov_24.971976_g6594_i0~~NODE_7202_length_801_cov_24.971976_g6594_i0.p1  ORF type:complete len:227 (-),score=21.37 NODE_7202_length_801_cov_24.971976_g6594_i0:119-757(-)
MSKQYIMFTVGHSNHSASSFIKLLQMHNITDLVDIRSFPASGRFPHFNKTTLSMNCEDANINYIWMGNELGGKGIGVGRRLQTEEGKQALNNLVEMIQIGSPKLGDSRGRLIAIMCSEGNWRECHRSMVSNAISNLNDFEVYHIHPDGSTEVHRYLADFDPDSNVLKRLVAITEESQIKTLINTEPSDIRKENEVEIKAKKTKPKGRLQNKF